MVCYQRGFRDGNVSPLLWSSMFKLTEIASCKYVVTKHIMKMFPDNMYFSAKISELAAQHTVFYSTKILYLSLNTVLLNFLWLCLDICRTWLRSWKDCVLA